MSATVGQNDDVSFVFNPRRRVRVTRAEALSLEQDRLATENGTEAGRWLGIAMRGGLDNARDVLLDAHTVDDLNKLLSEIHRQGRLDTAGLEELYAASQEPFST